MFDFAELITSFHFSDHQLILPVKELSFGVARSVIDLNYRYPLSVNSSDIQTSKK